MDKTNPLYSHLLRLGHSMDDECCYPTWDGYDGCTLPLGHDGLHLRDLGREGWPTRTPHLAHMAHVWAVVNQSLVQVLDNRS